MTGKENDSCTSNIRKEKYMPAAHLMLAKYWLEIDQAQTNNTNKQIMDLS
jgi:hypothetical protein